MLYTFQFILVKINVQLSRFSENRAVNYSTAVNGVNVHW